jgi:circadian clock protein KaiB
MKSMITYKFRLYVASNTPHSAKAMANLKQFCLEHLAGRHAIEVIDIFKHPQRALADQIYLTPTLIRIAPAPVRRVIGTLSEKQPLLEAIGPVMTPA